MRTEYSREVVEEGSRIENLLFKERDIIRGKGRPITKEDAQREITEFVVGLFRKCEISKEVYDYLVFGIGMKDTDLVFMLIDAREMFDKGMNWEKLQEFKQREQEEGKRKL